MKNNALKMNLENFLDTRLDLKISDKKRLELLDAIEFVFNKWMPAQKLLDNTLAGKNAYLTLRTENGNSINYGYCIFDETAELLGSTPWKHWKDVNGVIDYNNLKTELTDLMHFLPAILNVLDTQGLLYDINDTVDEILQNKGEEFVQNLVTLNAYSGMQAAKDVIDILNDKYESEAIHKDIDAAIGKGKAKKEAKLIRTLMKLLTFTSYNVQSWFDIQEDNMAKLYNNNSIEVIDNESKLSNAKEREDIEITIFSLSTEINVNQFCVLSIAVILDVYSKLFTYDLSITRALNELWAHYLVKSKLNLFRANNGYKEGSYIKMWNGREDNVVANEIANTILLSNPDTELDGEELYNLIQLHYDSFVNVKKSCCKSYVRR